MAKQTFTTGQVLTAAQMTSLQQTAMGGGSATAKTASYVLVAADAGTTVAMNAAGATTITVNTGLFAAGDTVFIQNLGAGACTVTAGTATVATAGSLILPQNDAGILYFTATGASIFYDYIQAGAVSPLTTKGDLYTFSTSDARLAVGTNGQVLTADSSEATGLKYTTIASGGATLLSTTTLSGATTTISSITGGYRKLFIDITAIRGSTGAIVSIQPNATANLVNNLNVYGQAGTYTSTVNYTTDDLWLTQGAAFSTSDTTTGFTLIIENYDSSSNNKTFICTGKYVDSSARKNAVITGGGIILTSAITSLKFDINNAATFSAGTVKIYGVN